MPYGEEQPYNQEEFTSMFGEKQGYDNGGVQQEQGGLGQLLIMLLMKMLGGGGQQGQAAMGRGTVGDISGSGGVPFAPGGPLPTPSVQPQLPPSMQQLQGLIGGQPQLPPSMRRPAPPSIAPTGVPMRPVADRMPSAIPRTPQMMPQGGRGNPLQALMGLLGGGR